MVCKDNLHHSRQNSLNLKKRTKKIGNNKTEITIAVNSNTLTQNKTPKDINNP